MKILFIIALLFGSYHPCLAGSILIPDDIPTPGITITEAVAIAQKQFQGDPKCLLVGVQWCLPAQFRPPVSDGTQYHPDDEADSYSWFLTYVLYDEALAKRYGEKIPWFKNAQYNRVHVIRVKKDGSIGGLTGTHT